MGALLSGLAMFGGCLQTAGIRNLLSDRISARCKSFILGCNDNQVISRGAGTTRFSLGPRHRRAHTPIISIIGTLWDRRTEFIVEHWLFS
jgi:hypothetical protein